MGVLMINDTPVGTTPDAKHTPFNPSGTDLTSTNVEDAIKEVNESDTNADDVIYDNSTTGLPASVQGAIDKTTGNISSLDTVELTATAAHAHAAGSTFLWIGQLVKTISAIAVGDTIAIGTNVTNTDICSVLSELNRNKLDKYEVVETVIEDQTLGNISLKRTASGKIFMYLGKSSMPKEAYVSGYIIPEQFRPNTSITGVGSSWGHSEIGNCRFITILEDGRIQVGPSATYNGIFFGVSY